MKRGAAWPRGPPQAEQLRERLGGGRTPRYVDGRWVHGPGSSPGGIRSRGTSALRELLLEAPRERNRRPFGLISGLPPEPGRKPQPARFLGAVASYPHLAGVRCHNPQSREGGRGSGRRCRGKCEGLVVRGKCDAEWGATRCGWRAHAARTPAGRSETGLPLRYYALDPGFHGVPPDPARTNREADGTGVS